ncbi:opacity protein-like surface antigen [Pacificibacter maritimus]|uniref:Opacity protein-like surface antigen n=1 Tax=Pacificibacter maritimus TaxID=762213 RepID=A0A3N4V3E5_9RHOB|nr:outer membrane beta-barrel protein [Pacificibacter maritimus]RPE71627.1 opacity protein-like surface antigen [Pacificibacter maritimus]
MKTIAFALASASTLVLAAPAFAGNLTPAAPEAPVYVAPVETAGADWTGFYAGATAGYGYGEDAAEDADDSTYGVFGGYNYDMGDWVVGGELEYSKSDMENAGVEVDDMTRLKLRAGYDFGKVVVYGIAGANYTNATIAGTDYSDTGVSYGIGADYAVTDNIVAGLEVLQNDFNEFDDSGADLSATTVAAKVGFRF